MELTGTDSHMAGLPSTYKFLAADDGSHVFNKHGVVLKTAGSQSITATDSASKARPPRTSPQVNVVPATAYDFIVTTGFVSPDVAGTSGTVTITAKDLYGNTVSSGLNRYEGTVDLTSTDPQIAGLPANYAFGIADAGSHVFNAVVLETAGNQSITATDSGSSTITGSSPLVNVIPAATHDLLVTSSFFSPDVAGTTGTVTITAKDLYGNTTGGPSSFYQGTVDLTGINAQMAGLPSTYPIHRSRPRVTTFSITSSSRQPATSRSRRPTRFPARSEGQAHP